MIIKKYILIFTLFLIVGITNAQSLKKTDYKISKFGDNSWITVCITNGKSITIMLYASQNKYHKSGTPIYIYCKEQ